MYGIDTDIDVVKHHGSTDPLILVSVLMHHGFPKEEVRPYPRKIVHTSLSKCTSLDTIATTEPPRINACVGSQNCRVALEQVSNSKLLESIAA